MKTILYVLLILISLVILINILWRFASRHVLLPCPVWLHWLIEHDNPFTQINRSHFIIKHLDLQPGMKVLDAGCGPGRLTLPIAQKIGPEGQVTALDIQVGMLNLVKKKALAAHVDNIQFLNAGIGDGKLDQSQFDRAILITVLGEIPDQEKAVKEIFTALKPAGTLSVVEVIFDPHFQRKSKVLALATAVGFREKKTLGNRFNYIMQFIKPVQD